MKKIVLSLVALLVYGVAFAVEIESINDDSRLPTARNDVGMPNLVIYECGLASIREQGKKIMYHLTHINIHQFRGFRDLNFENLGRVNLLVGMNNAGKTSVLEALSLYCCSFDLKEWVATASRRRIRQPLSLIESLKWFFPQQSHDRHGEIQIEAQGHFEVREVRASFEELSANQPTSIESELDFDQDNEELVQGAEIKVLRQLVMSENSLLQQEEKFELWENEDQLKRARKRMLEHTLPVSTIMPYSHQLKRAQMRQMTHAKTKGFAEQVLLMIQQIDPGIENLEILSNDGKRFSLYFQHRELGLVPVNMFGEGVQRSLAIVLSLSTLQNGVLLIDELEAGIHTSVLQSVFSLLVKACRDYNVQLFATTHSLEALDAILANVPEDSIVVYRLPNPIKGGQLKRFEGDLLHHLRYERGLDVR
jgi:predicted ATP-dependent endonuclease of OLD family